MVRRLLAAAALLVALVASIPPLIMSLPFVDRRLITAVFVRAADRTWWPDYPRFIEGVRAHTRDGDSITILVPTRHWDGGYSYAYYRASYLLAGREVLPLVTEDDRLVLPNLAAARYVAIWNLPPLRRGTIVWRGNGGLLMRQK